MGNKIITEKDFWECTGGLMPTQYQSTQEKVKNKKGEKYILKSDTATSSFGDFSCKKLMLVAAILAAIIAVAVVATGGAALVLIGAIAGAAGAAFGAVIGSLLCGQLVAKVRKWKDSKSNFTIFGIDTITGDHTMICPIFGDEISFNPNIKTWTQAYAIGMSNFIKGVAEGAMVGGMIGMGGGLISGGGFRSLFAGGGKGFLQGTLNLVKGAPRSLLTNLRLGITGGNTYKVLDGTTAYLDTYGETGDASLDDFKRGVKESTFTDINAIENIYTTGGTMRDYCALGMLLLGGGKSKGTGKNHVVNEPHGSGKTTQNKNHATEGVHTKPADPGNKAVSSDNKAGHVEEPTPKTKPKGKKPKEKKPDGNDAHSDKDAKVENKLKVKKQFDEIELENGFVVGERIKGKEVEFKKQLGDQQKAINDMSIKEWLENRANFKKNKNTKQHKKDAKKARDEYRKAEINKRIKQNLNNNKNNKEYSFADAKTEAINSMKGKAALHNPDGIAGGKVNQVTGMGDKGVNSSIGSQWKGKVDALEQKVIDQLKTQGYKIPPISNAPSDVNMNVKLI